MGDVAEDLAGIGPFFAVTLHDAPPAPPPGAPWRPLSELPTDPARLAARVEAVRAAFTPPGGEVELRVAASAAHLGLVARVLAPSLALAALGLGLGGPADPWWQDRLGGPFPLSVSLGGVHDPLGGFVDGLTRSVGATYDVSPQVLWGNVASAVSSAHRLILEARPDAAARLDDVVRTVMRDPRLAGEPAPVGPGFRRASCCLLYRIAGRGAVCGDCVLDQVATGARRPPSTRR